MIEHEVEAFTAWLSRQEAGAHADGAVATGEYARWVERVWHKAATTVMGDAQVRSVLT